MICMFAGLAGRGYEPGFSEDTPDFVIHRCAYGCCMTTISRKPIVITQSEIEDWIDAELSDE